MIHVGVLSSITGGFFYGEVLSGIVQEVAAAGGCVTLLRTLGTDATRDEHWPAPKVTVPVGLDHVDGYIAIAQACDDEFLHMLRAAGKPVVVTNNTIGAVDAASVVADNSGGVIAAVEHLIEHGHSRIAFVGNLNQTDMVERHAGYCQAMAEHGLAVDDLFIPSTDHVETGGEAAADALLSVLPRVTAVVTSTDRVALGLIRALVARGVRVPQDVAVIGFDNVEMGWQNWPPLATIDQQVVGIGTRAAQLLIAEIAGERVEHRRYTVAATLVSRMSCGCSAFRGVASRHVEEGGRAMVAAIGDYLGLLLGDEEFKPEHGIDPAAVVPEVLSDLISSTLQRLYPTTPSPEILGQLIQTVASLLNSAADSLDEAGLPGRQALDSCLSQLTLVLSRLQALSGLDRAERLSTSLLAEYDVATALLSSVGTDPSDLHWLDPASVRLGCLGLWDGPPERGLLRISGVYDPGGALHGAVDPACTAEEFPPRAVTEQADPAANEVAFVIPVKDSGGDYGYLALVGQVDADSGCGRVTYNHWATMLGVALQQQQLVETVRQSEERYSLATHATQDGLWDWDVVAGRCYYSQRCEALLGAHLEGSVDGGGKETALELAPWMDRIHPEDLPWMRDRIRHAVVSQDPFEIEHRVRQDDGTYRWMLCRARALGPPGKAARRVVGALSDTHDRRQLEERLRQAALFDEVTGLPNRRLFLDRLRVAVEQRRRRGSSRFAVLFLDLDGFKLVNDSLGHLVGDQLLQVVAERLRSSLRAVDTAARFGGDEFAVLLTDPVPEDLLVVTRRIQDGISAPVTLGDQEVSITASIGIATADTGYLDPEDVLRDADIAMYRAKEIERGSACLFDPAMHQRALDRLRIRTAVVIALDNHEFVVHYQPIIDFHDTTVTRFEALVRWQHPTRGLLGPGEFLPSMEGNTSIVALGRQVLEDVCAQIAQWRRDGDGDRPVNVSVNVSHREFWSPDFLTNLRTTLDLHAVPPQCLSLELTESIIMTDPDEARALLGDLHALGIGLHIDDFGTGHSSLHLLRTFPVDTLKIDGSFVRDLTDVYQTAALVRAIIVMSAALRMSVIAECVETHEQAVELQRLGCTTAQGWLYARAMPADEAGRILGTRLHEQKVPDTPN
jgi:diguanylate cyclase (GGDEF)-like protein/PAS domain S-box-containing protein